MNKFCIIGNVTRDAEIRSTPTGQQVCSFSVAVTNRRAKTNSDGTQTPEETMFVRVSFWGDRGVAMAQYIKKGNKVYVEGPLQQPRIYTAQDGTQRIDVQMMCNSIELLTPRAESGTTAYQQPSQAAAPAPVTPAAAPAAPQNTGFAMANDNDLPF